LRSVFSLVDEVLVVRHRLAELNDRLLSQSVGQRSQDGGRVRGRQVLHHDRGRPRMFGFEAQCDLMRSQPQQVVLRIVARVERHPVAADPF
jgi:hypothetical protein